MTNTNANTNTKRIAPRETLEVHELLTFKNVCATKATALSGLVKDQELKSILQQDFTTAQGQIKELQGLLQASDFATSASGNFSGNTTRSVSH